MLEHLVSARKFVPTPSTRLCHMHEHELIEAYCCYNSKHRAAMGRRAVWGLGKLVCVLLLASKGTGEIPEGRSEHFITVGGAAGARRYFVVRNPTTAPSMAILLLHDSVKPEDVDGLAPGARSEVRAFENRLRDVADLCEGNGALLVSMYV
jgi:hypothetical protein